MAIQWNKVTWYSKVVAVVLAIGIFFLGYYLGKQRSKPPIEEYIPEAQAVNTSSSVKITTKTVKEENFSGTVPVISGTTALAVKTREYVEETVAEFKKQADADVPAMRKEFGADSPTASYTLDINAKYLKGSKAESVVISVYTYTGGAHGNSSYKVISASQINGKILSLSDMIKKDKQTAFTEFVKKELNAWRPDGANASPVFPEEVKGLTFSSFTNWSMDDKNLTLYFSQYEIGPGVLGPVTFPLSLEKIKNFLN